MKLPARTAHAVHALIVASRENNMPVTAQEVLHYDEHALSARGTGNALAHARRLGLATLAGRYWIPTNDALDMATELENRAIDAWSDHRATPDEPGERR